MIRLIIFSIVLLIACSSNKSLGSKVRHGSVNGNCDTTQHATELALSVLDSKGLLKDKQRKIIVAFQFNRTDWEFQNFKSKSKTFAGAVEGKNSRIDVVFTYIKMQVSSFKLGFQSNADEETRHAGTIELKCKGETLVLEKINYLTSIE